MTPMTCYLSGLVEALSETAREELLALLIARMPQATVTRAMTRAQSLTDEEIEMIRTGRIVDAVKHVRIRQGVPLVEAKRIVDEWRAANQDYGPSRP